MTDERSQQSKHRDPFERPEVQWGVGCLLGFTALIGLLIITLLIAIALEPPRWVQMFIGVALVGGGAALAWLVATALARSKKAEQQLRGPTPVENEARREPEAGE